MYEDFALIYDRFQEIDYVEFIEFYKLIFEKHDLKPHSIIDLGCGSGSISILLAAGGYQTTGIDISEDMLAIANNKAIERELNIQFLNQDMTEFTFHDPVDAVISSLDCINYLNSIDNVKKTFQCVYQSLVDNGVFIFDINSEYKLSSVLGNNTFVYEDDNAYCVWECGYFPDDNVTSFDLNFFIKDKNNKFDRYSEYQEEFVYQIDEIINIAKESGFSDTDVFSDLTLNKPDDMSERLFFVLRK